MWHIEDHRRCRDPYCRWDLDAIRVKKWLGSWRKRQHLVAFRVAHDLFYRVNQYGVCTAEECQSLQWRKVETGTGRIGEMNDGKNGGGWWWWWWCQNQVR
jgi:hypothetical protein